ncbi:phosphatidate cytidylyltransferase [Chitinivorax tropicus]|uniref:Phosphatidate cytidylyltransferase n=1 Tax=Chitinivorax tropicus TaxID=714531 RepID=A0A840MTF9_9PROT|nr:phosphatidate cytidylyltransferase [Chitinivorax tropicus]MBB5019563.1 phosphatidate cytidylyltransferase [Chitinivorax tropicus]
MLKTRVLTALVLLPIVLAALFGLSGMAWGSFALFICTLGAWEWARLCGWHAPKTWLYAAVTVLLGGGVMLFWGGLTRIHLAIALPILLFWCILVPGWLHWKWPLAKLKSAPTVGWLLLLSSWLAMVQWHEQQNGPWLLLAVLMIAWVADTAAYFSGKAFGKHKLAPTISPGKSWEGVVGAFVGVTIYGVLLVQSPLGSQLGGYAMIPAIWLLTALSIMGDLLESLFKRQAGVKDSSQLLPGHGGILDRIDSQLAVLPVSSAIFVLLPLLR